MKNRVYFENEGKLTFSEFSNCKLEHPFALAFKSFGRNLVAITFIEGKNEALLLCRNDYQNFFKTRAGMTIVQYFTFHYLKNGFYKLSIVVLKERINNVEKEEASDSVKQLETKQLEIF